MRTRAWPGPSPRFEIGIGDARYPDQLRYTPDPPPVLRGFGDPDALTTGLAIIGARKATPCGLRATELFSAWAASAGHTVVSGAAIGCDQAAHRGALAVGGRTVAVLGTGADVAYPGGVGDLLCDIAETGAVVSELAWGHPPAKWTFRARNRIIAGLACALVVVEAGLPSGTFLTADAALAAGRDVLVVPGSIFAPEYAGTNRLLRQGARPITDVSDLASELSGLLPDGDAWGGAHDLLVEGNDLLLAAIRANPSRPDDLARAMGLDIVTVARRIGVLETAGHVVKFKDGRYGPWRR